MAWLRIMNSYSSVCGGILSAIINVALIRSSRARSNHDDPPIRFTQFKGRNQKPTQLELPILPVLQQTIDASPTGDLNFLVNDLGRPFTDKGFGNWFCDRCIEAGVPGRAHGLRKAGATIAAENGATTHELMAIFGCKSLAMAEKYTRTANQTRLARSSTHHLVPREQNRTESCPTEGSSGTFSKKNSDESNTNFGDGARGGNRTHTPCGTRF